jgi:hypothetical protein
MIDDLYDFRENLIREGIFFCFNGPVSQNILAEIGSALEQRMKLENMNRTTMLRVFSMMMEMAQNIMRYSVEESDSDVSEDARIGSIVIGHENNAYFVLCGNMVYNTEVDKLKDKLEKIRDMDRQQLRRYHKEQIRRRHEKGSQGAGLGFIGMAKKASRPIEFSFRKIDEEKSYFSLKTVIYKET